MSERKQAYFAKLLKNFDAYSKVLIVGADNVGSNHMQQIRISSRGKFELLMGKNTMIRKAIKGQLAKNPDLANILPHIKGNVGLVFTDSDLKQIRDDIANDTRQAPARIGAIAPCDVWVEAGNTTLDPSMTSFMQALNIASRINKGVIEIINRIHLIKTGEKVTSSQAALLEKLNINPFKYGLIPEQVYDEGTCYPPSALDITEETILKQFSFGVQRLAALSLKINYPTVPAIPHYIGNCYQNLCAVSIATDYTFDRIAETKELLSNPEALAAALAAAPAEAAEESSAAVPAAKEEAKEEVKEEEEEEEDDDMGFGLFD